MQKTFLIFSLFVLAAFARIQTRQDDFKVLWSAWKSVYSKSYGLGEDTTRYQTFIQNYNHILKHNGENHSYKLGLNQFADLTSDEFKNKHLGGFDGPIAQITESSYSESIPQPTAGSVDWRTKGVVTPVRDEGQCGATWAIAAVEAIESAIAIKGKGLTALSVQQVLDCSKSYDNFGCSGGYMDNAFQYVKDKGLATEADYPYKARDQECQSAPTSAYISGFKDVKPVKPDDITQLTTAVNKQPVAVAVDATNWQLYKSGVFDNCSDNLNHAGLIVGYTSDAWIVKNQWATTWGEEGYIRLKLGNTCGVTNVASYPVA